MTQKSVGKRSGKKVQEIQTSRLRDRHEWSKTDAGFGGARGVAGNEAKRRERRDC